MKESIVYFSLGSNIGDRKSNLINCIKLIEEKAGNINLVSSIYKNSAQGFDGDYFYNLCLEITTSKNPQQLLSIILKIEQEMGRKSRDSKNYESRIIDIDIILFDNLVLDEKNLKIPHPKFHERNFVLLPLIEINNQLINPKTNISVEDYLKNIKPDNSIEKLNFNYQEV